MSFPRTYGRKTRNTLDRSDWVQAATHMVGHTGIPGLRIELLARQLHVTKGSFYWHFRNRQGLIVALLEQWKVGRIKDILTQAKATPGQELQQLHTIIALYSTRRNQRGIRIELAIRDWARNDALAAEVVSDVDNTRIACAHKLFATAGFSDTEACHRAHLLYAYAFGASLLGHNQHEKANHIQTEISAMITALPVN